MILAILLSSLARSVSNARSIEMAGTIYIMADGSVVPSTAPILNVDNVTYIFTDSINDSIVIQKDNIKLDGKGYTLKGAESEKGISLSSISNVTIKNVQIENFTYGIHLQASTNITIFNNTIITNLSDGIYAVYSDINTIYGNNVSLNNRYGIILSSSGSNKIFHNNFIENLENNTYLFDSFSNGWDNGYPSGGNYWSNYVGNDLFNGLLQNLTGSDGIGDTSHVLDTYNQDNYPLFAPINLFDAGVWDNEPYQVEIVSNSSVRDFQLNITQKILSFNVMSETGSGFGRITVPNVIVQNMWQGNYTVLVDGEQPLSIRNWTDESHTYIYFTYPYSNHQIIIIPELPSAITIFMFTALSLAVIIIIKRKKQGFRNTHILLNRNNNRQNQNLQ